MTRPKNQESTKTEARLQQAITAYKENKNNPKVSLQSVARDYDVPRQTLKDHLDRKQPRNKAQENTMQLTHAEEKELVRWITTLTECGYAPRYRTVRELAEIIRNRRVCGINDDSIQLVNYGKLSKDWVTRFMSCHPQLASVCRKCIEASRIKDISVERLTKWFEDLHQIIEEYKIKPENIYNMDESGFAIGDIEASQRIINTEIRQQFQAKPARQEWVTAVKYVSVDGTFISPLIIFKGENLSRQWISASIYNDWQFACNTKGWTSNEHGIQWLRSCFKPAIQEKADIKYQLLICDGHDSHITGNWIGYCNLSVLSSEMNKPLHILIVKLL